MMYMKLGELVDILGGQIMTRIKVSNPTDECIEERKVIVPKAITDSGIIDASQLAEEKLKVEADEKRIAKAGDIVIKLNSPYTSAMISEESMGCIVPSFCAIIRIKTMGIDRKVLPGYLLAFLNSSSCRNQLDDMIRGTVMTLLSVGKLKEVNVPIPGETEQFSIAMEYMNIQHKLNLISQIEKWERMKNDTFFSELEG